MFAPKSAHTESKGNHTPSIFRSKNGSDSLLQPDVIQSNTDNSAVSTVTDGKGMGKDSDPGISYKVQSGDGAYKIAQKHGVPIAQFLSLNGLKLTKNHKVIYIATGKEKIFSIGEIVKIPPRIAQQQETIETPVFEVQKKAVPQTMINIFVTPKSDKTTISSMDDLGAFAADGIDDATQLNELGANNATEFSFMKLEQVDNLHTLKVDSLEDLIQQLTDMKAGTEIGIKYLYFSSHGHYNDPSFYIGSHYNNKGKWSYKNRINASNVSKLGLLSQFLNPSTKVLLMACHTGGGWKPKSSNKFVKAVANQLNTTVFANRSWSLASGSNFEDNLYVYTKALYGEGVEESYDAKPNAIKFMGSMLRAMPQKDVPDITNALILKSDGTFRVMESSYNKSIEKVIKSIDEGNFYKTKKEMINDKIIK